MDAAIYGQHAMALLDTGATLSVISEQYADRCLTKECRRPADLDATSATNHKLNFSGKVGVPIVVGGKTTLTLDLYIAKGFFRDILFGMDFMNEAQATFRFPSHSLTIEGVTIPTKIGKLKPAAHSICDLFTQKACMVPPRTAKAVNFRVPLNPLGDAHVKEGDLVRVEPLGVSDDENGTVMITPVSPGWSKG